MTEGEDRESPAATTRDVLIASGAAIALALMVLFGGFGITAIKSYIIAEHQCSRVAAQLDPERRPIQP